MISRDTSQAAGNDARATEPAGARREPDEVIEVLREVWTARGQTSADLEEIFGPAKSCKNMQNVGFDALAGPDGDMRAAWQAELERDGKLSKNVGSVRDLVLGQADSR